MPILTQGRRINRVLVVDDEPGSRDGFSESIEDLGLDVVCEPGPMDDPDSFIASLCGKADAVLSDFRLRVIGHYSNFDGDRLVATCYQHQIPALLCSSFTDASTVIDRSLMRFIPVFLPTTTPQPEDIEAGFIRCVEEFAGNLPPSRRPWRTLIHIHDVDDSMEGLFHVILPGWNVREKIPLWRDHLPANIQPLVQPGKWLHAQVNIGAEEYQDLYFDEWETE
ncbi:MAG: hypothetical protein HY318_02310 [Armatimonadetes bacterium]|nr:hypothetical protein [Armatimonadota bacterium]